MLLKVIFLIALLSSCGTALWMGRDSERWTAISLLCAAAISPLVQTSDFVRPELGILVIDLALLAYLMTLALRSDRFWPLWAAAFQIVGTTVHLARMVDTEVWPFVYGTAQIFWSYPVLIALATGTWLEARYRRL